MKKHLTWALAIAMLTVQATPAWALQSPIEDTTRTTQASIQVSDEEESVIDETTDQTTDQVTDEVTPETPTTDNTETQDPVTLDGKIILALGSPTAILHGELYTLDVAPATKEGNTYVELRFVVEQLLEATTQWDSTTRQTTITKDDKSVILTPGSDKAIVNGAEMTMPGAVIIENNRTLVPLRFLSEEFGVQVDYKAEDKTITLTASDEIPVTNTKPTAVFMFEQPVYIAGQSVNVIDQSYDEDGDAIVAKLWMLDGDSNQTSSSFQSLLKKPKAGMHQVSLKVKDAKGVWSDWTTQTIQILPNEAPVVTEIIPDKKEYAQGEEIKVDYTYTNESWENITDVRWSYRAASEASNKKTNGLPDAIFEEGEYIITLELTDEYGNKSEVAEHIIKVTSKKLMSEFEYKFTKGQVGDMIDNFGGTNFRDYKEETNIIKLVNDQTLFMSNSPERVTQDGLLYQDVLTGRGRIMIHHINGYSEAANAAGKKNIVAIATNETEEPITLTISNKVIKGPVTDQLYLGQQLLVDYFKGKAAESYVIQPGESVSFYNSQGTRWAAEEGLSGLMDFNTTGPLTVRTAAITEGTPISQIITMPVSATDAHVRGTFPMTERFYRIDLNSKTPTSLILCKDEEEWTAGVDAVTGEVVKNKGNYGITYRITVTAKEDTGIILNGRGGLFRGAIRWNDRQVYLMPQNGFLPGAERAAIVGVAKAGETVTFEYMLPNGSAAPVLIGFIPASSWNK